MGEKLIKLFKETLARVLEGIFQPKKFFKLNEQSMSGPQFFFQVYGLVCFVPLFSLNLLESLFEMAFPGAFRFQDINPWTLVYVMPVYFLVGPLMMWIFSHAYSWGNSFSSAQEPVKRKTGWYVGTFFVLCKFLFLGLGIALYSTDVVNHMDRDEVFLMLFLLSMIGLWLWVAISATRASLQVSFKKAILGLAASVGIFFFIGIIPLSIIGSMIIKILF